MALQILLNKYLTPRATVSAVRKEREVSCHPVLKTLTLIWQAEWGRDEYIILRYVILYYIHVCAESLQLCLTLCGPMDYSLPGSSVHGILQARILAWAAIPLQGIFLTQESNSHLLCVWHWQVGSLPLVPPGKPILHIYKIIYIQTVMCILIYIQLYNHHVDTYISMNGGTVQTQIRQLDNCTYVIFI